MPFVYFICEQGNTNCFKIGKTENHPADRLDQLQTGNPRKLVLYKWIEINDCSTAELYLHVVFSEKNIRGEWFAINMNQIDNECDIISSNDQNVKVSGSWENYSDEDRLKVKLERRDKGKYRGKTDPIEAAKRKSMYLNNQKNTKIYNTVGFLE